ncbi:MAG: SBBP repeat-containing protein [Candidatus Thorarchaeota archaeon]
MKGKAFLVGLLAINFLSIVVFSGIYYTSSITSQDTLNEYTTNTLVKKDPLKFSTFLGGSETDDYSTEATAIEVDEFGNTYICGTTYSPTYPTTPGAFDRTHNGGEDIFVTKLSSDGSTILFSTFIGGSSSDTCYSMKLGDDNCVYITGLTTSDNFPISIDAYDNVRNGLDCFILKLNATGNAILYSSYFGGSSTEVGQSIDIVSNETVFVTGETYSSNFPTTIDAYDTSFNGVRDAFLVKFALNSTGPLYSSYFGGTSEERDMNVALDSFGNVFVGGRSDSTNFPTTTNAFQEAKSSSFDCFIFKLLGSDMSFNFSSFVGGNSYDALYDITVEASNNICATGFTSSTNFPTTNNSYSQVASGDSDCFLFKLSSNGSLLLNSTFLGGSYGDVGYSLRTDSEGNFLVTGETSSYDLPTTINSYLMNYSDHIDAFIAKFSGDLTTLLHSSYMGGYYTEKGNAIAVDNDNYCYITGYTYSSDYPTTFGAYDRTNPFCSAFVTKYDPFAVPDQNDADSGGDVSDILVEGYLLTPGQYNGTLIYSDNSDCYKVSVPDGNLSLVIVELTGSVNTNFDLYLYDNNSELVGQSAKNYYPEKILYIANGTDLYIKVAKELEDFGDYTLTLTITSDLPSTIPTVNVPISATLIVFLFCITTLFLRGINVQKKVKKDL